ncbi:MAG: hypothetical protein HYT08_04660 [Candidatus Levybacteria bacterium]|nr:hypothetical protein [Candidatus Levybacteria bacterium]
MVIETISSVFILSIAIFFLNNKSLSMPMTVQSTLIVGIIVAFLIFSAYIFREKSKDERESIHILTAGRISYLVGVGALILGIVFQALVHNIDPWLIIALCAMITSKLLSRIYSYFKM